MNLVEEIFAKPSIIELLGATDTGRTKIALKLISYYLQINKSTIAGYIDTDQQLSLRPLEQNRIDLQRFYYFSNPTIFDVDILVLDSLPTASKYSSPKYILSSLRQKIRVGKIQNVIVINQKRFDISLQEETCFATEHVRKFCDYTIDFDTKSYRKNLTIQPKTVSFDQVLPNIIPRTWSY